MQLDVLYHDDYLVAINKPAGLVVHRSSIDKYETKFAVQLLRDQIGQHVYPVHRLDKPTSGVLLFSLDSETTGLLSELFARQEIKKEYRAIVRGYVKQEGIIDYALEKEPDKMADNTTFSTIAQKAVTHYHRLSTFELPIANQRYPSSRYSLVQLIPGTGRRHQLRRHMKHIFHPIIGDTTYGDGTQNQIFRNYLDCHRLMLHAHSMSFIHPHTGANIHIEARAGEQFENTLHAVFPG